MFARFKFNLDKVENWTTIDILRNYHSVGNSLFSEHKKSVRNSLDEFLSVKGIIDAEQIEKEWFPQLTTHFFLSHSHLDEDLAIDLAGFLYTHCGIISFIDSTVWGYADELLKQIDRKYCLKREHTYDYEMRNQSTAHVHMLLQGAIAKMIDRSESVIFINTPNSLNIDDIYGLKKTSSPWIYSELLMASTFPPSHASRYHIPCHASVRDSLNEHVQIPIGYTTNLQNFLNLEIADIINARNKVKDRDPRAVLNQLYIDKGLI